MRFTIRPAGSSKSAGGFSVVAYHAREALEHVRKMVAEGAIGVEISDEDGEAYDLVELERLTAEREGDGNG